MTTALEKQINYVFVDKTHLRAAKTHPYNQLPAQLGIAMLTGFVAAEGLDNHLSKGRMNDAFQQRCNNQRLAALCDSLNLTTSLAMGSGVQSRSVNMKSTFIQALIGSPVQDSRASGGDVYAAVEAIAIAMGL